MKRQLLLISIISLLLCSCSKQEREVLSDNPVFGVELAEEPGWGIQTKSLPIMNMATFKSTYTSFGVTVSTGSGVYKSYSKVNIDSGNEYYSMESPFNWVNSKEYTFYALAPYDFSGNTIITRGDLTGPSGTSQTVSFTYDIKKSDPSGQPDLMFGWYKGTGNVINGKKTAKLTFYHPLAALSFSPGFTGETLKYIQLDQFGTNSTCTVNCSGAAPSFSWGTCSKTATYHLNLNEPATNGSVIGGNESTFMVIPQTLGSRATVVLETNVSRYTLSLAGTTLVQGERKTVVINRSGAVVTSEGGAKEYIPWDFVE